MCARKWVNLLLSNIRVLRDNPIPVKAAMAAMGFCDNFVRLPLTPMEQAKEAVMLALMREQGLKV